MKLDLHVHTHHSGNTTINGEITAPHIAALMPWVDGVEIINGSRLPSQNLTAQCLADADRKIGVAGSDSHTRRGIGRTWVEAPAAHNREEFLAELHAGRVRVGGRHGNFFTMASDMMRLATGFYVDRATQLAQSPLDWRRHAFVFAGLIGLPLVAIPLAGALAHFILEVASIARCSSISSSVRQPDCPRWPEMNVAVFTDNDFDKVNGVTTTFKAALEAVPAGMHLRVYTAGPVTVESDSYLALRSIGLPIPFYREMQIYLPRFWEFLRRAQAGHIDVIHLTTPGPIGLAALFVAWRLRLPLIGSFHTDLAAYATLLSGSHRLGSLMREYMRWPYGRCARVLVPSEHTRQLLIAARSDPDRIDVWPRGVDTALFSPARRSQALRDKWHVSDRRPALLYVGRVSREKGLMHLPAISDRLHERGLEHRFVIAGDGPLLSTLRQSLPDAVFTGSLSRAAVAEAFASADCFVFPSSTDTAGNVVLEAQASGLPVIVSGTGGPRENMVAGSTGAVCHRDDPQEWADAIAVVLAQPTRAKLAHAARQYALTRTWDRAMEPLYRTYRDVYESAATAAATTAVTAVHRA